MDQRGHVGEEAGGVEENEQEWGRKQEGTPVPHHQRLTLCGVGS